MNPGSLASQLHQAEIKFIQFDSTFIEHLTQRDTVPGTVELQR